MKDFKNSFMEMREEFEDMWYDQLGMCGCGDPEGIKSFLHKLLLAHKKYKDSPLYSKELSDQRFEVIKNADPEVIFEFIFHILDDIGYVEHGSSVGSCWFTDKGERFIDLLSYEAALQKEE